MVFALGFDDRVFVDPESVFAWARVAATKPDLASQLGPLCVRGKFAVAHDVGGFWLVVALDKLLAGDCGDQRAFKNAKVAEESQLESGIKAWSWREVADA